MPRKPQPKAALAFRYDAGPPKRIRVTMIRPGSPRETCELSTAEARACASLLWDAIDAAEADKIALRDDPTPKKKPKRERPRSNSPRAPRASRLKRIEAAALNLLSVMSDLMSRRAGGPETQVALAAALAQLRDELGAAGDAAVAIAAPATGRQL